MKCWLKTYLGFLGFRCPRHKCHYRILITEFFIVLHTDGRRFPNHRLDENLIYASAVNLKERNKSWSKRLHVFK